MKILISLLCFHMIFYTCKSQKTPSPIFYKSNGIEGVIFPAQKGYELIKFSYMRFTPVLDDIQIAEKILSNQIEYINKKRNKAASPNSILIYNKLKNYKRQYFGYIDKGYRIIIINFLKSSILKGDSWKKGIIAVEDGGEDFWNIKANLFKKSLFDLKIDSGNN